MTFVLRYYKTQHTVVARRISILVDSVRLSTLSLQLAALWIRGCNDGLVVVIAASIVFVVIGGVVAITLHSVTSP